MTWLLRVLYLGIRSYADGFKPRDAHVLREIECVELHDFLPVLITVTFVSSLELDTRTACRRERPGRAVVNAKMTSPRETRVGSDLPGG